MIDWPRCQGGHCSDGLDFDGRLFGRGVLGGLEAERGYLVSLILNCHDDMKRVRNGRLDVWPRRALLEQD
jgi:hypothetical protein